LAGIEAALAAAGAALGIGSGIPTFGMAPGEL